MRTRAVNIHSEGCDVYIGRGSGGSHMNNTPVGQKGWLGNPYQLTRHSREEAIELFAQDFRQRVLDPEFRAAVILLKDKRLGCFCKPAACHGDVIAEYLNSQQ